MDDVMDDVKETTQLNMMEPGPDVLGWFVLVVDADSERWWVLVHSLSEISDILKENEIEEDTVLVRFWTLHECLLGTVRMDGKDIPLRDAAERHAQDLLSGKAAHRVFCSTLE
jgi:hypothetical protein